MNWLNLLLGIGAPLIIPFYDYLYFNLRSQTKKPDVVVGPKKDNAVAHKLNKPKKNNAFISELPSAFIGTSIWGLTYQAENISKELAWLALWLFSIFIAIGFYIAEKNINHSKKFTVIAIIYECILFILVCLRIFVF